MIILLNIKLKLKVNKYLYAPVIMILKNLSTSLPKSTFSEIIKVKQEFID